MSSRKRKIVLGLACLALLLVLCSLFIYEAWGAEVISPRHQTAPVAADNVTGPTRVKVGVYVLNISKFDTASGSFLVDFYLDLSSDQPSNPGSFEFANGRATSVDKSVDDPSDKFYRIQAGLASNLNLSKYPFDAHNLTIELEDKEQTNKSQVYEVDLEGSGLDPVVQVPGWQLDGWQAAVSDHVYKPYDTTFSHYVFSVQIHRSVTAAILKIILPALTILLVGMLALALASDKIIPRLTLSTGSLTGTVLFHLNMTSSLPPLAYLTFGDRFMLYNYVALALVTISTLLALYFTDRKQTTAADRVHRLAMVVVPCVWVALQLSNLLYLR